MGEVRNHSTSTYELERAREERGTGPRGRDGEGRALRFVETGNEHRDERPKRR